MLLNSANVPLKIVMAGVDRTRVKRYREAITLEGFR
jgi:hypothetical protein